MARLPAPVSGRDLVLSAYVKVLLGQTLASLQVFLHRIVCSEMTDKQALFARDCNQMSSSCCTSPWCTTTEAWLLSDQASAMFDCPCREEQSSSCCKAHDHTMQGPDTSVKVSSKELNEWLVVAKNKVEDDEEDEEEEDGEDEDAADDDYGDDNGEGEEDVEGNENDDGGEDDDYDEDDDDGKGDEEDEEGGDEEDEDKEEDEEDDDETPEPPKKKRK